MFLFFYGYQQYWTVVFYSIHTLTTYNIIAPNEKLTTQIVTLQINKLVVYSHNEMYTETKIKYLQLHRTKQINLTNTN